MMKCQRCGFALKALNESCERCPTPPIASPTHNPARRLETGIIPNPADKRSFLLEFLAFVFPLFGLLLYFAYYRKGDWPIQGDGILKSSLWGLVLSTIVFGFAFYQLNRMAEAWSRF